MALTEPLRETREAMVEFFRSLRQVRIAQTDFCPRVLIDGVQGPTTIFSPDVLGPPSGSVTDAPTDDLAFASLDARVKLLSKGSKGPSAAYNQLAVVLRGKCSACILPRL